MQHDRDYYRVENAIPRAHKNIALLTPALAALTQAIEQVAACEMTFAPEYHAATLSALKLARNDLQRELEHEQRYIERAKSLYGPTDNRTDESNA